MIRRARVYFDFLFNSLKLLDWWILNSKTYEVGLLVDKKKGFFQDNLYKIRTIWNMDIHTPSKGVNFLWLFRFSVFMPNTSDGHVESWKGNLLKWGNCFYQPTMHTAWKCARNMQWISETSIPFFKKCIFELVLFLYHF